MPLTLKQKLQADAERLAEEISMCDDLPDYHLKYQDLWEDVYDISHGSRYSMAIKKAVELGADSRTDMIVEMYEALAEIYEKWLEHGCLSNHCWICNMEEFISSKNLIQKIKDKLGVEE